MKTKPPPNSNPRLQNALAFCAAKRSTHLSFVDGPVESRENKFATVDVLSQDGKVVGRLRGPDTYRQYETWRKALAGLPFIHRTWLLGCCTSTCSVDANGEICHFYEAPALPFLYGASSSTSAGGATA